MLVKGKIRTQQTAIRIESNENNVWVVYHCEEGNHEIPRKKIDLKCAEAHMDFHSKGKLVDSCTKCTNKYKKETGYESRYGHLKRNYKKTNIILK